jgi:hypothetical protein
MKKEPTDRLCRRRGFATEALEDIDAPTAKIENCVFYADEVAQKLGVSKSSLDGRLVEDRKRSSQLFAYHGYRGKKRIWTRAGYQALESALKKQSEPGGALACSSDSTCRRSRDVLDQ